MKCFYKTHNYTLIYQFITKMTLKLAGRGYLIVIREY